MGIVSLSRFLPKRSTKSIWSYYLAIGLALICGVMLFAANTVRSAYESRNRYIHSTLEATSSRIASLLSDDIEYLAYYMEVVGTQITTKPKIEPSEIYSIIKFTKQRRVQNLMFWNVFSWVTPNNMLIADGDLGVLESPKDLSNRDYIQAAKETPWKIQLGKAVIGAVSRQWIIPAGMAFSNKQGNHLGSLAFGFQLVNLKERINSRVVNGTEFLLFDDQYRPIEGSGDLQVTIPEATLAEWNLNPLPYRLYENQDKSIAFRKVGKYPLIVGIRVKDVLDSWYFDELVERSTSQFVLLGLFVCVALFLLWRSFVSPVRALSYAAENIEKDDIPIPMPYSTELRQLAIQLTRTRKYLHEQKALLQEIQSTWKIAEQAQRAKATYLSQVDSKLRKPVNAIIRFADLMRDIKHGNVNKEQFFSYSQEIYESASQMLLSLDKISLDISEVHMGDTLHRAAAMYQDIALKSAISMEYEVEESLPTIQADELRIVQVFSAIIANVLKHVLPSTRVLISVGTDEKEENVTVIISYSSSGAEKEEWSKINEPFNLSEHVDIGELATDVGLPLAHRFIEEHHGHMELETNDSGAIIRVSLPIHGTTLREAATRPSNYTLQ